jgi:FkbM family methyltransferase
MIKMSVVPTSARLVGTPVGDFLLTLRDKAILLRAALFADETIGTIYNDQLASALAERLCAKGMTFVDVGAHIGSVIAAVLRRGDAARIIAIEPIPEKVIALRRKFPSLEVHECALGPTDGMAEFFVDTERSGYSSLERSEHMRSARKISVKIRPLDSIAMKDVDVIKIDVEGAELGVLQGASLLVETCRPTVIFESAPPVGPGKSDLWKWFDERDYVVLTPNRVAHLAEGLSLEGFVDSHLYPRRTTNYVGVPKERRAQVRTRAREVLGMDLSG